MLVKLEEAERILTETKEAHERIVSKAHPHTLVDVLNLMTLKHQQGDIQARRNSPTLSERFDHVFGPITREALSGNCVGQIEFSQNNLPAAERESRLALERSLANIGQNSRTYSQCAWLIRRLADRAG